MALTVQSGTISANTYMNYGANESKALVDKFYSNISSAAEKSTTKGVGDVLGMTMIPFGNSNISYGLVAKYSEASTPENPIVRVTSNYGGENVSYDVKVNEVNPRNASQLEMFALMSYQDDQGITDGGTFGSYQRMKTFGMNAEMNGYCNGIMDSDSFMGEEKDWIKILQSIMKDYFANPMTYAQGLDCQKLIAGMEKWGEKYSTDDAKSVLEYSNKEWELTLDKLDSTINQAKENAKVNAKIDRANTMDIRSTTYEEGDDITDPESGQAVSFRRVFRNIYTKDGIISGVSSYDSKKAEFKDTYNWKVEFNSEDDYERTMEFLDRIPEGDTTKFLTREDFWHDFVDGKIDEEKFFKYYETLDHGKAIFLKRDENGKIYEDKEMINSEYYKYFGVQQVSSVPMEELQRELELSALRDRGFNHYDGNRADSVNFHDALKDYFDGMSSGNLNIYGADETIFPIDEWIQEIINRTHMEIMESLIPLR